VRREAPDGSYSRVEFSPWHVATYDANDTVDEAGNRWYEDRTLDDASDEEKRAARLAATHAGTPSIVLLDSLGRDVVSIADNRFPNAAGALEGERHLTFTKLDAEGKPLWIRDARKNRVMQYIVPPVPNDQANDPTSGFVPAYDIAGNLLFQHSMDADPSLAEAAHVGVVRGRWSLNDAAGKPLLAWDYNERQDGPDASGAAAVVPENRFFFTRYDALHRPIGRWLSVNGAEAQLVERFEYVDARDYPDTEEGWAELAEVRRRNLCGQLYRSYDPSGLKQVERLDFKGKPLELRRQLAGSYRDAVIDWNLGATTAGLEAETFVQITEYDALSRMTRLYQWHRLEPSNSRVAVYQPRYNARGLLAGEDLVVRATKTSTGHSEGPGAQRTAVIEDVRYNAKGQRERIAYGNGTVTRYQYDAKSFRLVQLRTTRPNYDAGFPDDRSNLLDDRVLQQLHYTYDPTGNITTIHDEAYEPVFFQNQIVEAKSRYIYDALYRLLASTI
jgi:hypothetical protein